MKKILLFFGIFLLSACATASDQNHENKNFPHTTELTPIIIPSKSEKISTLNPKNSENFSEKICVENPEIKVFMYHYVRDDDPKDTPSTRALSVTPDNFDAHMQVVRRTANAWKISLMNGEDFVTAFEKNCFPNEKIWIFTADDGWSDNAEYLAPIAEKYQIPFIFGIITGSVDKKWFMSLEEIKNLSENPLFTMASHTITHREVNKIPLLQSKKEICESKTQLEKMIEKGVKIFIYPMGKIGNNSPRFLAECGYSLAWSTHFGKNLDWKNPQKFIMNRVRVHHDIGAKFFEDLWNQ